MPYSAEPLRFKALPVVDSASNILYIIPGIFGYYLFANSLPPISYLLAGFAHIFAMHLFSAIPDIQYDKDANIRTTAVVLQKTTSLLVCFAFWSIVSVLVIVLSGFHPLSFLVLIYPILPLTVLLKKSLQIEKVYWLLPYINTSLGGFLFVMLVLSTIS